MLCNSPPLRNSGFTLIELSIVLVIIGLIVGGILVGQDLIKAAALRATVSQKIKFDAAVNTFRGKYNGLPADLSNYAMFTGQLTTTGLTGAQAYGDGNGLIQSGFFTSHIAHFFGETKLFWRQLLDANLIGENVSLATTAVGIDIPGNGNGYVPAAKLGKGAFWVLDSDAGVNYFGLGGITYMAFSAIQYVVFSADVITPNEAYQIDTKLDDGMPITGSVRSIATGGFTSLDYPAGGAPSGDCYDTDTNLYATADPTEANSLTCNLTMRAGF